MSRRIRPHSATTGCPRPRTPADAPEGNWLPTPKDTKYRLTFRFYRPIDGVTNGTYYPPLLVKR